MWNPRELQVSYETVEPYIGQRVEILDWEMFGKKEISTLCKLPYLTVESYTDMLMQDDEGNYYKEYQVFFVESGALVPPNQYKLIY